MNFLQKKISFYLTSMDIESYQECSFMYYFTWIASGEFDWCVSMVACAEDKSNAKRNIPCVTPSGVFAARRDSALMGKHTGVIVLDLDYKDNQDIDIDGFKETLKQEPSVLAVHKSISQKGLAVYVTIADNLTHNDYNHVRETFEMWYNVKFDKSTSNISRLRYVSYDPDIYVNPEPYPFDIEKPVKETYKPTIFWAAYDKPSDLAKAENAVNECISAGKDPTSTYADWISAGFAIAGEFGENGRGLFHLASSNHPEYSHDKTDKKYNNLLRYSNGTATIATLYYLLKQ